MPVSRSAIYRPEIDGLRAVSILAVVLYHARFPGLQAGYLGVDVFFVISGFLITSQLLSEAEATGTIRMAMFYARRVRRLVPAFLAMAVGASVLALGYLLPLTEQRLFGNALSRSALFYYNIAVWRGGYSYDGPAADRQVLMHTWSLGVEEQFYLVWPLICLVAVRAGRPLVGFSALTLTSLVGAWWVRPLDPDAVFFLLPFRAWELGLGACVAASERLIAARAAAGVALAGAALVVLTILAGRAPSDHYEGRVLVVLGTGMVLAYGHVPNLASRFLGITPMVYLGRMSYAWYLWHWPLLVIDRLSAVPEPSRLPVGPLAAGLLMAWSTYHWIERPAQRVTINDPSRVLLWGGGAIGLVALGGLAIQVRSDRIRAQPENVAFLRRLGPPVSTACDLVVESVGCDLSARRGDGPGLLLWGDSFARALAPALAAYSESSGTSVRLIMQRGCPPLLGVIPASRTAPSKADQACRDALRGVESRLRESRSQISGVILAARWPAHVPEAVSPTLARLFDLDGREIPGSMALPLGLRGTLDFLHSIGLRVLVVGAPPSFPFDVPTCLWRSPSLCSVDRSWEAAARTQARAAVEETIRGRYEVRFVELFNELCPGPRCSAGTLDEPLLSDRTHLSAIVARDRVMPILARHLDWLRDPGPRPAPAVLAR